MYNKSDSCLPSSLILPNKIKGLSFFVNRLFGGAIAFVAPLKFITKDKQ